MSSLAIARADRRTATHLNRAPTATVTAPSTGFVNSPVTLTGSGTDADGDALSCRWTRESGPAISLANGHTWTPSFTASLRGAVVLRLTVTDARGAIGIAYAYVNIGASSSNTPPIASAGTHKTVPAEQTCRLSGAGYDADGDWLSYSWARVGGWGSLGSINESQTPNPVLSFNGEGSHTMRLTVQDGRGGVGTSTVVVTALANQPPAVFTGPAQTAETGATVTLSCSARDPDGDPTTFGWTRTGGTGPDVTLVGDATFAPRFVPSAPGTYTFTLTATDNRGGATSSSVTVTVTQANRRPVVTIGPDRAGVVGKELRLVGFASDPDGDPLVFEWLVVSPGGSAASVTDADTPSPVFIPAWSGNYTAWFTVRDGRGGVTTSNCRVAVSEAPPNRAPTVSAGLPQVVTVGSWVYLAGSAWDPEGDSMTCWWQPSGTPPAAVTLNDRMTLQASFVPAVAGTYTFSLGARDSHGNESSGTVTITVSSASYGTVSGVVKDALTGLPLAGVTVQLLSSGSPVATGTTGASGTYSVSAPAGTGHTLEFTRSGYLSSTRQGVDVMANVTTSQGEAMQVDSAHSGAGQVSGQVVSALNGTGISGVTLELRAGLNATTSSVVRTVSSGSGGSWAIADLPAGVYTATASAQGWETGAFPVVSIGSQSKGGQDGRLSPLLPVGEVRIVLSWGPTPSDLDSHLFGPQADGTRFHVYFDSMSTYLPHVGLDHDHQLGNGFETVTIHSQLAGTYRYFVHDWDNQSSGNSQALAGSGAVVTVYRRGQSPLVFHVPAGQGGTCWKVFELTSGTITAVNRMSYESEPTE